MEEPEKSEILESAYASLSKATDPHRGHSSVTITIPNWMLWFVGVPAMLLGFTIVGMNMYVDILKARHIYVDQPDVPPATIQAALSRNVTVSTKFVSGSGAKIGNGLVLTARHVVADAILDRAAIDVDDTPATVVGYSPTLPDVAVLRLTTTTQDTTPILDFGQQRQKLELNLKVMVVGNPDGRTNSFLTGVVSRLHAGDAEQFEITMPYPMPGISGAVVYSFQGDPLGIIQQVRYNYTVAVAHSNFVIEELLKQVPQYKNKPFGTIR